MDESIEVKDVIARVKILFKGHPELIMAFNIFLPDGQKITGRDMVKDYGNGIPLEYVETMSFLNNIKIRFREDEDVYLVFLEFLERYRDDNDFERLYKDAARFCFKGHPDLLKELTCFIPYSPDEDTGTENDGCKPSAKNEIDEDMNQLDVLVEYLESTIEFVGSKLLLNPETPICIKDNYNEIHEQGNAGVDTFDQSVNAIAADWKHCVFENRESNREAT
ncbi:Paired amphipathic helix protein sin3-like [Thalictrum thalictroides]|uniref:Paired amphipathic helix protein sin3-like n=1 Tax=Thalictrum thalictroides TaxID=46969 RepID=A0A7J6V9U0_THATH|nr:Paired amphipathic helix protein sin3-like [Thalictrum thalictroides]